MGLLRPATPLSIIFLVAFVLLLLSTLSTPVIHAIPLGTFQGWNFGVFGYCKADDCSDYKLGYDTDGLFSGNTSEDFELPSSTRHSLSAILIVHPIAALLVLICFGLAVAAHFHSPAHSPRYLLALLILTIPTLLVTLLAFLVDILLFVPHMAWGGWIVLAATILIIASSVVTCAMRRTLVSRKARKKRIAENADMSGANYYDNLNQNRLMADEVEDGRFAKAESPPPMSTESTAAGGKEVPPYAAFEMKRTDTRDGNGDVNGGTVDGRRSSDDRTPLNPTRDPSIRSASTGRPPLEQTGSEGRPPMPMGARPSIDSQGGPPRRPSRDQYGHPIPPAVAMGAGAAGIAAAGNMPPPGPRHPRGGYGPPRGGYWPRGGWRGGPRGGPPPSGWRGGRGGRGGYGGPPPGMMMGRGGMQAPGPPPGYAGPGYGAAPGYGPPPSSPYGAATSGSPYGGGTPGSPYGSEHRSPPPPQAVPMPMPTPTSDPGQQAAMHHDEFMAGPIGQAIEMDERTGASPGSAGTPQYPSGYQPALNAVGNEYGLRDSDGDVAGMVGLQQGQSERPTRRESERSTSVYSGDGTYVPPRAQWAGPQPQRHPDPNVPPPLNTNSTNAAPSGAQPGPRALPLSPVQASPASPRQAPRHLRSGSDAYYEDVDPRFAIDPASEVGSSHHDQPGPLPSALTPGGGYSAYRTQSPNHLSPLPYSNIPSYVSGSSGGDGGSSNGLVVRSGSTDQEHSTPSVSRDGLDRSFENLPSGARSPGEGSDTSHFTSISQRPVNPNWRPGPGSAYGGGSRMDGGAAPPSSASAVQRRREDVILTANPDFSLPGMGPSARGGGGRGRGRGLGAPSMTRGGGPMSAAALGLTPSGRYPTEF